ELDARQDVVARRVRLPSVAPGWHRLEARCGDQVAFATVIAAPDRVAQPVGRAWGWMLQLYAMRSERSWAVGEYADLRTLAASAAADGAGLLLVNPLHAETPVLPLNPSPYSPSSRRFRSPLWLRVEDVPEYRSAGADLRAQVDGLKPINPPDRVDRDIAWAAKRAALELLWPVHRRGELAAWMATQGPALQQFGVFCVLAELHGPRWQEWPSGLRCPDSEDVAAACVAHADRVAFFCWLQLLVDEQLADVAGAASAMSIGIVHDLAVGVDVNGFDGWALQDVLAMGIRVGAPPDSFNQRGQDWGLPPWRPDKLREAGYAPFRDMLRAVLRHAGGLRLDHVMGLFRLWWLPAGGSPATGTYVDYDADAMLAVLALEASRAGAVVVGEDLGTVEDRVREALDADGVLGSAVLWFQRDPAGPFLAPTAWRAGTLASVTTHDLPTAAGFLVEEHVRVRHELGQLGVTLDEERDRVRAERMALLDLLTATGLLAEHDNDPVLAMHALLAASPSQLVLAAFGDAVGDLRQPNLPGTVDEYPNWRLPVADATGRPLTLDELLVHPGVRRLVAILSARVR
nr:4-alpha-glucanotransferase [Actinomycetota bacterium]